MTQKTNLERLEACEKRLADLLRMNANLAEVNGHYRAQLDIVTPLARWAIEQLTSAQSTPMSLTPESPASSKSE